jgi:hypothetical protein
MLLNYHLRRMTDMSKNLIFLSSILILALAAAAGSAQEINATEDNATRNNTTLNSTMIDDSAAGAENATALDSEETGENANLMNLDVAGAGAKNLSTASIKSATVAPISQMAGIAPLVAAGASSIQVARAPEDSYKIGTGVGGIDQVNPEHVEIEPLSLGIPIKPMRDTGKMFFVCDLV